MAMSWAITSGGNEVVAGAKEEIVASGFGSSCRTGGTSPAVEGGGDGTRIIPKIRYDRLECFGLTPNFFLKKLGPLPFIDTHHKILTTFLLIPGWFFLVRLFLDFALSRIRSGVLLRRSLLL